MPRLVQIETCFFWDNSLYMKFEFQPVYDVGTGYDEMYSKMLKIYYLIIQNCIRFSVLMSNFFYTFLLQNLFEKL